jgi:hypothetical protein
VRTRLDEIVDEVFRLGINGRGLVGYAGELEIAERAFRHGVERAVFQCNVSGWIHDLSSVQPAPAAFKWDGMFPDRRKGERRFAKPWELIGSRVYGGIELPSSSRYYALHKDGPFCLDRRFHKNRRVPIPSASEVGEDASLYGDTHICTCARPHPRNSPCL